VRGVEARVKLGVTLPQFTGDADRFLDGARRAEALGLDSLWLFDHFWPPWGGPEDPVMECWSALSYLAAVTERIEIGTLVTRATVRHPVVLAKMAATAAATAPGRVTVAVGSGDAASRSEDLAFGIDRFESDARVAHTASTMAVLRSFFSEDAVTLEDSHVSVSSLPPSPRATPPQLWVGGSSRGLLKITARLADGWNAWQLSPESFSAAAETLGALAPTREVTKTWGGKVVLGEDARDAEAKLRGANRSAYAVVGGPEDVASHLRRIVEAGASHLIVTFPDPWRSGVYDTFAGEVADRLRLADKRE
jgi:alkanesulfonate monooxygenase SsuD/methylene tetrahydromethanopterin reductase-like flavin-dependent oxidoreductase (luciferase family)